MRRALVLACVLAAGAMSALLALPAAASAHAVLLETRPERGAVADRAPSQVVLRFNESVEIAFGAVRVFDARGGRVDEGAANHPGGDARSVAMALRDGLADGNYTATYRVISADSHPVSGGFVFTVGQGGAAAAAPVADLLGNEAGPVTDAGLGAAKALSYAAIALAVGGVLFLMAVWLPSLREASVGGDAWAAASDAFGERLRRIAAVAIGTGIVASAAGIVLQGATAGATTGWQALDPHVVGDVLETRFGTVWGFRLLDWALLGVLATVALRPSRIPRPAGASILAVTLGYLVVSPALSGHASTSSPSWALLPANSVHVLAMSAWAGGLALLVFALPAATRGLEPADRSRLLAAALPRFSALALAGVAVLLATGVLQSLLMLEDLGDLLESAFGRAILAKAIILAALIGLGAWNRRRAIPALREAATSGAAPGREGLLLRRSLRSEVVLIAGALAATAALTSYPPPESLAGGPFAEEGELGAARLELTVEPARVGANEIHIYLSNPRTGAQYDRFRRVRVEMRLPSQRIGPLEPRVDKAGPGHWVARGAQIVPRGDWRLTITGRVSEFEQPRSVFEVPVE